MTNFDFLRSEKRFASFAGAAAAAEMIFPIDIAACAVNIRRATELTVKWMFENDRHLTPPKRDSLASMLDAADFCAVVGNDLSHKLDFIRRVGNNAAHTPTAVTREQTALALRHLFDFENFVAIRYRAHRAPYPYDTSLLTDTEEISTEAMDAAQIGALVKENRTLKRMLRSLQAAEDSVAEESLPPLSEADTRRLYIETDLTYAGWRIGVDCFSEYPLEGLPGGSGSGYADYVLFHEGCPLAVVESQAAADDPAIGRQQAKLYADALEEKFGYRPVIFLTGGFETRIWVDTRELERVVAGIYSKSDLLRRRDLLAKQKNPTTLPPLPADSPADRPYQREAVTAILSAFCTKGQRTVCLSMAPGTGKTRTALAAAQQLWRMGWAKNILYLTENALLNRQAAAACREFPDMRCTTLADGNAITDADILVATFEDLMTDADDLYDARGAHLFTPGHFDLILLDEAEATHMQQYRSLLDTFDARFVCLSSAPYPAADTIFSYSVKQAVADGYIAPPRAFSLKSAILTDGIHPKMLSTAGRRTYEKLFQSRHLPAPKVLKPGEMFKKYYPEDTVRLMLETLFSHGIQRDGWPAKTIIFTKDHAESERIYAIFGRLYPTAPPHFCRVLDLTVNYPETLLADFSNAEKMPRIALSHDLLADGVDIPAVENLVFFQEAGSRTAFWRMLGRGMRKVPGKKDFFVLDMHDNFRRFADAETEESEVPLPTVGRLFTLRVRLAATLQSLTYATSCEALRESIVQQLQKQIRRIPKDSFAARRHLGLLDRFTHAKAFEALTPADVSALCRDIAPLLPPAAETEDALAFDERLLSLMLYRAERHTDAAVTDLTEVLTEDAKKLAGRASLKKIVRQKKLLNRLIHNDFAATTSLTELEEIRLALRPLIRYLPRKEAPIPLPFADRLLSLTPLSDVGKAQTSAKEDHNA